jgi:hypothetical protein
MYGIPKLQQQQSTYKHTLKTHWQLERYQNNGHLIDERTKTFSTELIRAGRQITIEGWGTDWGGVRGGAYKE